MHASLILGCLNWQRVKGWTQLSRKDTCMQVFQRYFVSRGFNQNAIKMQSFYLFITNKQTEPKLTADPKAPQPPIILNHGLKCEQCDEENCTVCCRFKSQTLAFVTSAAGRLVSEQHHMRSVQEY